MALKSRGLGALLAAWTVVVPGALAGGGVAYASNRQALANASGNPYFPLVVGATWKYKQMAGPAAGQAMTVHVVSAHKTAAGEAVEVQDSVGAATVTGSYVIGANGAIEIEVAAGGSARATISGSGNSDYFIPRASQISSCHPCRFTAVFTASSPGGSIRSHMTEAATSAGVQAVHVPAGTFRAQKLQMVLKITSAGAPISFDDTVDYSVYLAKGVGMVETGAGTVSTSVMGHTTSVPTGSEELIGYTP